MSTLVSGVGCANYFNFYNIEHNIVNGNVEFSGEIKTVMTCNETIMDGELVLEISATDGFVEQEFSETAKTGIVNYITDQSSYNGENFIPYDLIYEIPEEAPRFHYQAFVPTKTRIDFISIFLMNGPYGKLYVSLHEDDNGPGNKITDLVIDDADNWITIRDGTSPGLTMLESSDGKGIPVTRNQKYHLNFSKTGMNPVFIGSSPNDTYGVGDEFDSKFGLGNGIIVDNFMEVDLIFETHTLLFTVPFEYTWEAPAFEKNTTLTYNFVLNGNNRTGKDISSTSAEGEFELEGTGVPIVINETNETVNTTENETSNTTIKKCPVCAECSEWSYCSEGWQTRLCEECDDTVGKCVPTDDQRPCNDDSTMEEAFEAIQSAEEIVDMLKDKVDISEAESLLGKANDNFDSGDYASAFANAEEAKQIAIKTDPTIKEEIKEPTDWSGVLYSAILLVVFFVAFKQRRVILGYASKYIPQLRGMSSDPSKVPVVENDNLYGCDYCGNRVAYNRIRTYQGKNICTTCARKKDLI